MYMRTLYIGMRPASSDSSYSQPRLRWTGDRGLEKVIIMSALCIQGVSYISSISLY